MPDIVVPKEKLKEVTCPYCKRSFYVILEEEKKAEKEKTKKEKKLPKLPFKEILKAAQRFIYEKSPGDVVSTQDLLEYLQKEGVVPKDVTLLEFRGYLTQLIRSLKTLGLIESTWWELKGSRKICFMKIKERPAKSSAEIMKEYRKAELV